MEDSEKVFTYKLDFYYQQALIYLVTLILYAGVRGSFIENEFTVVFRDPIVYIIIIFVIFSFVVLILNRIRNRKLVVTGDKLIFRNKFREREVRLPDIEWMHIGRERGVKTAGRFQMIVFKVKGRRRLFRIRVGRYEREKELIAEMQKIAERVPRGRRKGFPFRQKTEM